MALMGLHTRLPVSAEILKMENFTLNTREHYKDVLCGPTRMVLVRLLKLPIPENKVNKRRTGTWGIKTRVFGRQGDPEKGDVTYEMIARNKDMGINTAIHDAIARLCYRHRNELSKNSFGKLGWQKAGGAHILLTKEQKMKFSPLTVYNQDLEHYIKSLQMDLLEVLFDKEALHEELKAQKLEVTKHAEEDLEVRKLRRELENSRTIAHAKDVDIQKLKNQLQDILGRHRKLCLDRDYLAEELENIQHKQKKPRGDQNQDLEKLV
ncbi:hypothetical protein VPH35_021678 [Triticum aestivum]